MVEERKTFVQNHRANRTPSPTNGCDLFSNMPIYNPTPQNHTRNFDGISHAKAILLTFAMRFQRFLHYTSAFINNVISQQAHY